MTTKFYSKQWLSGIIVGVIAVIGMAVYISVNTNDHAGNDASVEQVVETVRKHMLLPTDEIPALLTVTDSSKLTTAFLKQSQNGDKVLIYKKYQKAIIYRPSIDRVIDIGPVTIDTPQQASP